MVRLPHYKCGEEYLAKRSRDGSGSLLQKSLSRRLSGRMLLVFYGDPSGDVVAADARDGKALWHFPTNGENKTSPITYTVDGKQFVGLAVGPNILGFALP